METKKKLQKGSHDLWEGNQKIIYHKIWNPRACKPIVGTAYLDIKVASK